MPRKSILDTPGALHRVMDRGIDWIEIFGSRKRDVVKSRKIFCLIAVRKMGYSGEDVARFLGITTSVVNRLAAYDVLSDTGKYHFLM